MSTVEFLLPIESLNVIANQISILADGGEVDGVKFMLAIMDVLTYFPPARPLQLLLKPLKGLAHIMPRKFRNHFIGALGGIANNARKGDFDTLWNVLPFLILAAEMYHDPDTREGIEFLMSTVNSSEDVLNWIDYLGLPAGGWVGALCLKSIRLRSQSKRLSYSVIRLLHPHMLRVELLLLLGCRAKSLQHHLSKRRNAFRVR